MEERASKRARVEEDEDEGQVEVDFEAEPEPTPETNFQPQEVKVAESKVVLGRSTAQEPDCWAGDAGCTCAKRDRGFGLEGLFWLPSPKPDSPDRKDPTMTLTTEFDMEGTYTFRFPNKTMKDLVITRADLLALAKKFFGTRSLLTPPQEDKWLGDRDIVACGLGGEGDKGWHDPKASFTPISLLAGIKQEELSCIIANHSYEVRDATYMLGKHEVILGMPHEYDHVGMLWPLAGFKTMAALALDLKGARFPVKLTLMTNQYSLKHHVKFA
jgi:hypothetical protein